MEDLGGLRPEFTFADGENYTQSKIVSTQLSIAWMERYLLIQSKGETNSGADAELCVIDIPGVVRHHAGGSSLQSSPEIGRDSCFLHGIGIDEDIDGFDSGNDLLLTSNAQFGYNCE